MGFRDINGESQIEHVKGAIFTPLSIQGNGPWTVYARVRDLSTISNTPGLDVEVGQIVTTFYTLAGTRQVATYIVDSIVSATNNTVEVVLQSLDNPNTLDFPFGNSTISPTIGQDLLPVVEGEPEALRAAKINNAIRNIASPSSADVNWTQATW
jgi:hypothetical protein